MTIDQLNKPFKCFYRHTTNNAIGPEVRNESRLLCSTNQRLFIWDRYPPSACYDWPNANMLSARVVLMDPHVSHEREVTYLSYQLFLPWEFWRVRELGNSVVPAYMTILREEVWGRFAIANERGYKLLLWVRIRMEDCAFGRHVLKRKISPDSCTWLSLRKWRALGTTTSTNRLKSTLRRDGVLAADLR